MSYQSKKIKWYFLLGFSLITIFVWVLVFQVQPLPSLSVSFLDVGQGDAIFIETPHRRQLLLDVGPRVDLYCHLSVNKCLSLIIR